jgi:hypothetical protein
MATPTTPPQSKKVAATWSSPSRQTVIDLFAKGGIQHATWAPSDSLTAMIGFFAKVPNVSFHNILSGEASKCFDFDSCKADTVVTISADFAKENEIGFGGFKTCHPAKIHTKYMMEAKEVVIKELYEKKGR